MFVVCGFEGLYIIGKQVSSEMFPERHHAHRLAYLDEQIRKLRQEQAPRTVIVGPSYAYQLEDLGGTINLGVVGIRPIETMRIIREYCSPRDTIIYPVGLDFLKRETQGLPVRREIVNKYFRRIEIGRVATQQEIGRHTHFWSTEPDERPTREFVMNIQRTAVKRIRWARVDMRTYIELSNEFPNLVYVLWPHYSDESIISSADKRFRKLFLESGVPCINLADTLNDNRLFRDVWHVSDRGYKIIRRRLRAWLAH
jgi:hypothetical protein